MAIQSFFVGELYKAAWTGYVLESDIFNDFRLNHAAYVVVDAPVWRYQFFYVEDTFSGSLDALLEQGTRRVVGEDDKNRKVACF